MVPVSGADIEGREMMTMEELEKKRNEFFRIKLPAYGVIPSSLVASGSEIATLQPTDCIIGAFIFLGISFPYFMRLINTATGTDRIKEEMKNRR